jgi:hypothetical protein
MKPQDDHEKTLASGANEKKSLCWSETSELVEVVVDIPIQFGTIISKNLMVKVTPKALSIQVVNVTGSTIQLIGENDVTIEIPHGSFYQLLDVKLHGTIHADDSTWSLGGIGGRCIELYLEKAQYGITWGNLEI